MGIPINKVVVCDTCGIDWNRHLVLANGSSDDTRVSRGDPNSDKICIALLKEDLSKASFPRSNPLGGRYGQYQTSSKRNQTRDDTRHQTEVPNFAPGIPRSPELFKRILSLLDGFGIEL